MTLLAGTHRRKVTTSIGIAMFDDPGLTGAEMLVNADLAMYDAKEAGRDRYAVHQTAETHARRPEPGWPGSTASPHALDHDRFTLFAQPIMDLATRDDHPPRAAAADDRRRRSRSSARRRSSSVAEKFGLISRIDRWVVDHAIAASPRNADREPSFEVNLSGASMGDPDLLAFIEQRLAESPTVDPSQLTFEVTETAAVANLGARPRVRRPPDGRSAARSRSTTSAPDSAASTT